MTERDDIDMLAAEYVLGTLDAQEREMVNSRRVREADLDSAIAAWEERLGPLNSSVSEIAPSADLLAKIEARLPVASSKSAGSAETASVVELDHWKSAAARWRAAAIAGLAAAAALAGILIYQPGFIGPGKERYVAIFNQGDKQPAFVLSVDLATRQLTIRPITADPLTDNSYELWIVSDRLGPAPQSLGLLDSATSITQKRLGSFDPDLLQSATFGISLEPKGGSPTGRPTGPALHGTLIPVAK